jgi:hypothetical protein
MTVIAWDGKQLAADRRMCMGTSRSTQTKLKRLGNGEVIASAGQESYALRLEAWYQAGADHSEWPKPIDSEDRGNLTILRADGCYVVSWCHPFIIRIEDPFYAWGAGYELALGAMSMGADAVRACEVAAQWDTSCGDGIDVMSYEPPRE